VGSSPGRVKLKTIRLVCVAVSPLSSHHKGVRAKTGYDDVGSFAAPIVSLELLLETIPKVDAKPEAKKNNTTIDIAGKVGFDLDASDLPNIVMIDNADTPITDFIVM
jgi:hypothetical protein